MLIQKCLGCYSHPFSELAPHYPTEHPLPMLAPFSLVQSFPSSQAPIFLSFKSCLSYPFEFYLLTSPLCFFFLLSLLILYILAILHHPFLSSFHQPPSKCLHSPPLFQLFHVLLCQKSQTLNSSSSQSHPLPHSACYPLGNCCCSQQ